MLDGHERSAWARTSTLACVIATGFSAMAGKRKKFKPSDFDPFSKKTEGGRMGAAEFGALLFGGQGKKPGKKTNDKANPISDADHAQPPPPPVRVRGKPR